jgi:hypothetical protein
MAASGPAPWSRCRGSLLVTGEAALELSEMLERPLVPLLPGGELPANDPVCRQVCVSLIESLIPAAWSAPAVCAVSAPPQPSPFLEHVVELRGYRTLRLHPAAALVLAEAEQDEFTAAAVTMGAEQTAFTFCHLARPLVELTVPSGSRSIEDGFARRWDRFLWDSRGHRYLDLQAIQRWLTGRSGDPVSDDADVPVPTPHSSTLHPQRQPHLAAPRGPEETWLADAFIRQWSGFWKEIEQAVTSIAPLLPRHPVPLIVSGGPAHLPGFLELAAATRREVAGESPFCISEIRQAGQDPYSVARGLLIHATLWNDETRTTPAKAA